MPDREPCVSSVGESVLYGSRSSLGFIHWRRGPVQSDQERASQGRWLSFPRIAARSFARMDSELWSTTPTSRRQSSMDTELLGRP